MMDRIFFAAFTFSLLTGGTLAVGSALFGTDPSAATHARNGASALQAEVVQLPRVLVVAKRLAPASTVARTEASEPAAPRAQ